MMKIQSTYLEITETLLSLMEIRDYITIGHSKRVSKLSVIIAEQMGMDHIFIERVKISALLHDIGKLGIPESILFKPQRLDEQEYSIIKKHPLLGYKILSKINWIPELSTIPQIVACHHEYLDGSGYPRGLKEIPLESQIITVSDIFDALSSIRWYHRRRKFNKIIKILDEDSKNKLNPKIVNTLKKIKLSKLIVIIEPHSKPNISELEHYNINDLSDNKVSELFNKYYYQRYLKERTLEFIKEYSNA